MLAVVSKARYQRARASFETAEALALQPEPSRETRLVQLELYRDAALWLALALSNAEPAEVWPSARLYELGTPLRTAELLGMHTALDDEKLGDAELLAALTQARTAVAGLFDAAEEPERAIARKERQRVLHRTLGVVIALVAFASSWAAGRTLLVAEDLAKGKSWRASSRFADCHPEMLECGGARTSIFFHTREETDPWVEIDLGAPTDFTEVAVHNRSDAVPERAVPLVIEVGDDQQKWREVARRDDTFKVWSAKLPATRARFIRLRVPRMTWFHLDAVKVYR